MTAPRFYFMGKPLKGHRGQFVLALLSTGAILCASHIAIGQSASQSAQNNAQAQQSAPPADANSPGGPVPFPKPFDTTVDPPQTLKTILFPDGAAQIGLPEGWTITRAEKYDVAAKGPNGESLRFGLMIPVIDPSDPKGKKFLNSNEDHSGIFVLAYATDPVGIWKSLSQQIAKMSNIQPPTIRVYTVRQISTSGPQKAFYMVGTVDAHDGKAAQFSAFEELIEPPITGAWSVTFFQVLADSQTMMRESATIGEIFQSYRVGNKTIDDDPVHILRSPPNQ